MIKKLFIISTNSSQVWLKTSEVNASWLEYGESESLPIITNESVANKLRNLKTNEASGLNDLDCKILMVFAEFFTIPLTPHVFDEFFKSRRSSLLSPRLLLITVDHYTQSSFVIRITIEYLTF